MRSIRATAPAKVNLFLGVLGRRPDGYHTIETLFQAIDLCDELIVAETSGSSSIEVVGLPELESENNLVMRALRWLEKRVGSDLNVKIRLNKRIPLAAGLGGGSSDAAAALLSIRDLFQLPVSNDELRDAAVSLGADVPFFLRGGSAVGEGIGELLTPVEISLDYSLLMVNPGFPVSTAAVYSEFSKTLTDQPKKGKLRDVLQEARTVSDLLHNDLQPVAESLYPHISEMKNGLEALGIESALMSGSGPTMFGLTEIGKAEDLRQGIPSKWEAFASRPIDHGVILD